MVKKTGSVKKSALHIESAAAPWKKVRGLKPRLEKATALVLARLPDNLRSVAKRASFTVLLTTDKGVQRLNHDFRGLNKPTNVLSFPQFSRGKLQKYRQKGEVYVGDLAVAYAYVAKEAKSEHKILLDHVTHLLIHGLLHLFGYDHLTAAAAARMERWETHLMAELGLSDPYAPQPPRAKGQRRKK
ncbi:MAG: rRNA maturation RNase YbeY [Alphaproteobacteria bacterium]|nr:rRNA maturation RNase YbeY [Alphaproteobacteria bacterium]